MSERKIRLLYIVVDYLSTLCGVIAFAFVRYSWVDMLHNQYDGFGHFLTSKGSLLTMGLFPLFMLGVYYLSGFYVTVINKSRAKELISTLCSLGIGSVAFFMVVLLNDVLPRRISNYELLFILYDCLFVTVYLSRLSLTTVLLSISRVRYGNERLIYIGRAGMSENHSRSIVAPGREISGVFYLDDEKVRSIGDDWDSWSASLKKTFSGTDFDGFFVSLPVGDPELGLKVLGGLYVYEKPIYVSADDYRLLTSKVVYDNLFSEPLMDISRSELSDAVVSMKRASDVLCSIVGLLLTMPVVVSLAIAVKLTSRGPAFYSQERIGYHRKPFRLYKLRSMVVDAEAEGPSLSESDDPRVTPIGRFMRKYRLDELPNLWNVLKGDMSLVGPRPEREFYLSKIRRVAPYCTLLHQVRPGLTSLGMVKHGYASTIDGMIKFGYASSVDEMVARLKYDLIYIQNLSLSLDLKILFYTIRTVVRGEGK